MVLTKQPYQLEPAEPWRQGQRPFSSLPRPLEFLFPDWQLPTNSGTKSYQNLLVEVYGMTGTGSTSHRINVDSQLYLATFYAARNGYYNSGRVSSHNSSGRYWQSFVNSSMDIVKTLYFGSEFMSLSSNSNYKGNGISLRCLVPLEKDWPWQLPTYSGTKSYQNLLVEVYGGIRVWNLLGAKLDTTIQNGPTNFIRSGWFDRSINNRNNTGYYWESTPFYSAANANTLDFSPTALYPQGNNSKGTGYSIRCLVRWARWQLPTYSGTKSYQNLLVKVYGGQANAVWGNWAGSHLDAIIHNTPMNFFRNGYYDFGGSGILYRSDLGYYWSPIIVAPYYSSAYILMFRATRFNPQVDFTKGNGLSLRCLVR